MDSLTFSPQPNRIRISLDASLEEKPAQNMKELKEKLHNDPESPFTYQEIEDEIFLWKSVDDKKKENKRVANKEKYEKRYDESFQRRDPNQLELPSKRISHSSKLRYKEHRYISWAEQYYHINATFPTNEEAAHALNYTLTEIRYFLENKQVHLAFERRGIDPEFLNSDILTPTQVAAAVVVSNFADTRNINTKLEQLGVNVNQYYAWLKLPAYRNFVKNLSDQNLENVRPEAITAFAQKLRQGDRSMLKMYFEMTGEFKDQNQEIQNLKLVIQRVIDAVAKNVRDKDTLQAVASEIGLVAPIVGNVSVPGELESQESNNVQYDPIHNPGTEHLERHGILDET